MTIVKYIMMALSAVAVVLCLTSGVLSAGSQGIILIVASALPLALGGLSLVRKTGMPRWASVVSMLSFLIAAMKTRQGEELQNIMMAAFFGAILAIVLIIKPDSAKATEAAPQTEVEA